MVPYDQTWNGRPRQIARLVRPGSTEELLPSLADARVLGVRETLLIAGLEQVRSGRKGVSNYPQTWLCSAGPIPPTRWPTSPGPANTSVTGFHRCDDDHA